MDSWSFRWTDASFLAERVEGSWSDTVLLFQVLEAAAQCRFWMSWRDHESLILHHHTLRLNLNDREVAQFTPYIDPDTSLFSCPTSAWPGGRPTRLDQVGHGLTQVVRAAWAPEAQQAAYELFAAIRLAVCRINNDDYTQQPLFLNQLHVLDTNVPEMARSLLDLNVLGPHAIEKIVQTLGLIQAVDQTNPLRQRMPAPRLGHWRDRMVSIPPLPASNHAKLLQLRGLGSVGQFLLARFSPP